MKPQRMQLSRAKGWRMPPNTVKVDRSTKWGNPWPIGECGPLDRKAPDAEGAVGLFRQMLADEEMRRAANYPADLSPLCGKNLACWCKLGQYCHADVLLEVVNVSNKSNRDLAFVVGAGGDFNYEAIYAGSEHEAIEKWKEVHPEYMTPTAERKPEWDGKSVVTGGSRWFRDGYGVYCSACGYETFAEMGGRVTRTGILCDDCYDNKKRGRT